LNFWNLTVYFIALMKFPGWGILALLSEGGEVNTKGQG